MTISEMIHEIPHMRYRLESTKHKETLDEIEEVLRHYKEQDDDLISRQAVLDNIDAEAWEYTDYINEHIGGNMDTHINMFADNIRERVNELSPVNPQEPKTDDMTSSHSELDIYKGCIDLMNDLLRQVYEWLEIVGIDVSEMDEDEQFATHFYTTEIVERLFLWKTSHSGGTSQRMKLKELGITDDAVLFDFAKIVEPQERSEKE